MTREKGKIDCFSCAHFYVTYDPKMPKGCRAMGFKSREMPSVLVVRNSGMECLRYVPKTSPPRRK